MLSGAVRFVAESVDARVVSPLASRLSQSVVNPHVLSVLLWDRIKHMTPQRARDLSRLLSAAVANAVGVLAAHEARALAETSQRLQEDVVRATASDAGRAVVVNTVATAAKVAQALRTPESKAATLQAVELLQSIMDLVASDHGKRAISSAGELVGRCCDLAASPEAALFLAEVATNVCHALEVEEKRRQDQDLDQEKEKEKEREMELAQMADQRQAQGISEHATRDATSRRRGRGRESKRSADEEEEKKEDDDTELASPTSSAADTSFETESNRSEVSMSPFATAPRHTIPGVPSSAASARQRARRSAQIERDVLLKMGVEPSMLHEIQRVLDTLQEEELRDERMSEEARARAEAQAAHDWEMAQALLANDDADAPIAAAFGVEEEEKEDHVAADDVEDTAVASDGVLLPDWHPESMRSALRRRHAASTERANERDSWEHHGREVAAVLARRRQSLLQQQQQQQQQQLLAGAPPREPMSTADLLACRVLAVLITCGLGLFLLGALLVVCRAMLALVGV